MKHALLLFLLMPYWVHAQSLHERTWFFGKGLALHFTNGTAVAGGIPAPNHNLYDIHAMRANSRSIAVSDAQGALQFFIQVVTSGHDATGYRYLEQPKVFDRYGSPFPNGDIRTINTGSVYTTLVVPHPAAPHLYYICYFSDQRLLYSLVNMSLRNGLGDIDPSVKDIPLLAIGSVAELKTTTIPSCRGVYLIARSRIANGYYSFLIDSGGLHPEPVFSPTGNLSLRDYTFGSFIGNGGLLKANNQGTQLASANRSGIELYDFEPCNGRLKNARLIDTLPAYGLCFSPDGAKLYASCNKYSWASAVQGEVYQYDLTQPTPAAIAASRNLVMRNPLYELITPLGPVYFSGPLGELKLGPDNRIYVSKNNELPYINPCSVFYPGPDYDPVPQPTTNNCRKGQYMHVIHQPNAPGMTCNPELDYLQLNDRTVIPGPLLQSDIRTAPASPPGTAQGTIIPITVCFSGQNLLTAPEGATCPLWDDSATTPERQVERPGTFWLQYARNCTYYTDTFEVTFIPLPEAPQLQYACPGKGAITIAQPEGATNPYTYTLTRLPDGNPSTVTTSAGHRFPNLAAGEYTLRIQSGKCDTTLPIQLKTYPSPEVSLTPQDTTIRYGDTITLQANGAGQYTWWPSHNISDANNNQVQVWPRQATEYIAAGRNAYGCTDTATIKIDIDHNLPDLLPNAFSPNGDGVNDVFRVEGLTYQQVIQFRVYNRYGQAVYSTPGPHAAWDGTFNGNPCDMGTYYYLVELQYPDGRRQVYKGDVVLLR